MPENVKIKKIVKITPVSLLSSVECFSLKLLKYSIILPIKTTG